MPEKIRPSEGAALAIVAFETRFESELTSRWQGLEYQAAQTVDCTVPGEKHSVLKRFFDDAEKEIGNVVHEYFPRLLQVAIAQRQHLGTESPLSWTRAQVLQLVCNFLGVDEKFDPASSPRDNSRLVAAAAHIALGISDDNIPADWVLPGWADSGSVLLSQLIGKAFSRTKDDAGSLPPWSRAKTLEWIKHREFWISRKLERQLNDECWEGIIEAGKSDVSLVVDLAHSETRLPERLERGKECEQLADEIATIKYKRKRGGLTVAEIQAECSFFKIWKRVEMLSEEDKDTFMHPGTWEPGYANLLLGKLYADTRRNLAPGTVNTWRKEYRAYLKWKKKNPAKTAEDFCLELQKRKRSYRKPIGAE